MYIKGISFLKAGQLANIKFYVGFCNWTDCVKRERTVFVDQLSKLKCLQDYADDMSSKMSADSISWWTIP